MRRVNQSVERPDRDAVVEECAKVADAEYEQHQTNYRNGGMLLDHYYATAAENVAAAIRAMLAKVKPYDQ